MKHLEFNEKKCALGVSAISEDAMAISNQVADLMCDKSSANFNMKMKESFQKGGSSAEYSMKCDPILFKQDEQGNLIKVQRDGGPKSQVQTPELEIPYLYR